MRLFIAIEFNDEMKDALEGMQRFMRERGVTGNFTKRANLHLTLAFIGDFDDPEIVAEAIRRADFRPFDISLGRAGSFGGRLWWAGIEGGGPLAAFTRRLRRGLDAAGIPYDRKKFSPHVTLVRKPVDRRGDTLKEIPQERKVSMTVGGVTLMQSDRGERGMIYTPVARI